MLFFVLETVIWGFRSLKSIVHMRPLQFRKNPKQPFFKLFIKSVFVLHVLVYEKSKYELASNFDVSPKESRHKAVLQ